VGREQRKLNRGEREWGVKAFGEEVAIKFLNAHLLHSFLALAV
jgi:hypothetical protein